MKILLATYWTLPHIGGLSGYVYQLKEELERLGHQVDLLGHHPDYRNYHMPNIDKVVEKHKIWNVVSEKNGNDYSRLFPNLDPWIKETEMERYSFELAAAFFGLEKYDLIHTQDIVSTLALSRVKPKQIPLIATIHGCFTKEFLLYGMVKNIGDITWQYSTFQEYLGTRSSDITIVPSFWLKDQLISLCGVPADQLVVIPYGINIDSFLKEMGKSANQVPTEQKVIACVARLSPVKGHNYLFHALAKLRTHHKDWVCWLIGDGPSRKELERLRDTLKLNDHVLFLGDRKDVPALLKQADIFVLPSIQDNLPYAVMEAQIAGKPVIATDAGGIPEIVTHEKTGLLSSAEDSDSLYQNLKRLLEDVSLREDLAQAAKERGNLQWSLNTMITRTLLEYEKIITGAKGGDTLSEENNKELNTTSVTDRSDLVAHVDSLFSSQPAGSAELKMDYETWEKILSALPDDYTIPDPRIMNRMKQHLTDHNT